MEIEDYLPGYVLEQRLQSGSVGETWRARDAAGEAVVVRRLPSPSAAARRRLQADAAVLGSIAGPHVVPVRDVVEAGTDVFVVTDLAPGGSLAAVLSARGGLSAHEVVTLLAPLARALAAAHEQGVIHGAVTVTNVVFSAAGRPMLTDFGIRGAGSGADDLAPTARDDVRQLAELGITALAEGLDGAPAALRDALGSARSDDPGPDAEELADLVLASCAAAPIGLVGERGAASEERPAPSEERAATSGGPAAIAEAGRAARSRARPRLAVAALVLTLLLAAAGVGAVWGRHGQASGVVLSKPTASPVRTTPFRPATSSASATSWRHVVEHLERRRVRAFVATSSQMLRAVYAPGSPGAARDLARLRHLRHAGLRPTGMRATVITVSMQSRAQHGVMLRVVDALSAYRVIGPDGRVAARSPARAPTEVLMTLQRIGAQWRIVDVVAAQPTSALSAPSTSS